MICDNVDLQAEAIVEKVVSSTHLNKTKREIVIEYQREEIAEPEFEDIPFVDHNAEALQSEKKKTATMELLVASLLKRVGDLENLVI